VTTTNKDTNLASKYQLDITIIRLFPDAARHELSKVISAHDNHH
jgi:hypothetical protein